MTEAADLVRTQYNDVTVSGSIRLDDWVTFKTTHSVEPQQMEPELVEVIGHLCTMAGELTEETARLSHALARRG